MYEFVSLLRARKKTRNFGISEFRNSACGLPKGISRYGNSAFGHPKGHFPLPEFCIPQMQNSEIPEFRF